MFFFFFFSVIVETYVGQHLVRGGKRVSIPPDRPLQIGNNFVHLNITLPVIGGYCIGWKGRTKLLSNGKGEFIGDARTTIASNQIVSACACARTNIFVVEEFS